jgi:hypothetical protein
MELKYSLAIKAGIIGGIIVAILIVITDVITIIGTWTTDLLGIVGCCTWLLEIVALVATGALAVRYGAGLLKDMSDALMASGFAGGVAGLIAAVISVVMAFVMPFLSSTAYETADTALEGLGIAGIGSLAGGLGAACCCAPIYIILAAILGAIGGAIYFALNPKK